MICASTSLICRYKAAVYRWQEGVDTGRSRNRQLSAERTPARGYGPLIRSERRSRTQPVLLQKIYEGAPLRQKQAGQQGHEGSRARGPLVVLGPPSKPAVPRETGEPHR